MPVPRKIFDLCKVDGTSLASLSKSRMFIVPVLAFCQDAPGLCKKKYSPLEHCVSQHLKCPGVASRNRHPKGSCLVTTIWMALDITLPNASSWRLLNLSSPQTRDMNYGSWYDIVAMYNDCRLSYPTDKLSALSGLAKHFQDLTKDEYMA